MSIAIAREPLPLTATLPCPPLAPRAPPAELARRVEGSSAAPLEFARRVEGSSAAPLELPGREAGAHLVTGLQKREAPSAFAGLLQSLAREVHRGESITRSALGAAGVGQVMGPAQLIALQAGIYRYGEAVDLASRLIDRATGAVKTVVQGT